MLLLSRLSVQKNRSMEQRLIQRNWKTLDAYSWRTLEKDNSTIVQSLSPLLCFVSAIVQEQHLWLRWYSSIHGMDLKLFLHRIITISSNISLVIWSSFKWLFLMCWQINNVSFTPLYKEVKTWRFSRDSQQFYKCQNSAEIVPHQSSLIISFQLSYLRNSRVLRVCIWFVLWTQLIVYQVFNLKQFSL